MKVELINLKGISKLEFEIPNGGLWLLTGLNGSGKTSLLAALYRIRHSRAFQDYYKTTATQDRLDTFQNSQVRYTVNNGRVTYSYSGKRWPPKPRKNAAILDEFPFSAIHFIEANGNRVEPYSDEITPRRIRQADDEVRSFMSYVLADNKWDNLKYVNTRRGAGSEAFLLPYHTETATHYFSEKNFSLGELCVLKLAIKLAASYNENLILIDEIEMALHPQAQVRLFNKIEHITSDKSLTVIFSTHSSTLIKRTPRQKMLFLAKGENGEVVTKRNVFPAHVLGELAFDEEIGCDFIFYVEDEEAKLLLEQICGKYGEITEGYKQLYKIVPVGGFADVIRMLERSSQIFPEYVRRTAFLDDDVQTDSIQNIQSVSLQTVIDRNEHKIKYLPCTPEVGVVDMLEQFCDNNHDSELNIELYGTNVQLNSHISSSIYRRIVSNSPRKTAKKKLDSIAKFMATRSGQDVLSIKRILYRKFVDNHFTRDGLLLGYLRPVFNV